MVDDKIRHVQSDASCYFVSGRVLLFIPVGVSSLVFPLTLKSLSKKSFIMTYESKSDGFFKEDIDDILVAGRCYRLQLDFENKDFSPVVTEGRLLPKSERSNPEDFEVSFLEGDDLDLSFLEKTP